jgi:hypothetical protein
MAAIHLVGVPCNTTAKKNPLETTEDVSLVTCKRCLKKMAMEDEAAEGLEEGEGDLEEVADDTKDVIEEE